MKIKVEVRERGTPTARHSFNCWCTCVPRVGDRFVIPAYDVDGQREPETTGDVVRVWWYLEDVHIADLHAHLDVVVV